MNDQEYEALPGIRRSDLWHMKQSPMHFAYHMANKEVTSPALIFGQAAHKNILEKETFLDEFAIRPKIDMRTKAGKEAAQFFEETFAGKTIIPEEDYDVIEKMTIALYENRDVAKILNDPGRVTEKAFALVDPETGETVKCKADIITTIGGKPFIIDYKTTQSCEDGAFERSARKYGYAFQAGFYTEVIEGCTLERHGFGFIAQEKTPPYASRIYLCDPGFVDGGKRIYHSLLRKYAFCKKTGEWPGYPNEYLYEDGTI